MSSFNHIQITTAAAAAAVQIEIAKDGGEKMEKRRAAVGEETSIGRGQTTVGDRLQPSLTATSMFNAVG